MIRLQLRRTIFPDDCSSATPAFGRARFLQKKIINHSWTFLRVWGAKLFWYLLTCCFYRHVFICRFYFDPLCDAQEVLVWSGKGVMTPPWPLCCGVCAHVSSNWTVLYAGMWCWCRQCSGRSRLGPVVLLARSWKNAFCAIWMKGLVWTWRRRHLQIEDFVGFCYMSLETSRILNLVIGFCSTAQGIERQTNSRQSQVIWNGLFDQIFSNAYDSFPDFSLKGFFRVLLWLDQVFATRWWFWHFSWSGTKSVLCGCQRKSFYILSFECTWGWCHLVQVHMKPTLYSTRSANADDAMLCKCACRWYYDVITPHTC